MDRDFEHVCTLCGAHHARRGTTALTVGRSGVEVALRGVPAFVCDECGEAAIPGPLATLLSDQIEAIIQAIEQHNAVPSRP